MTTFPSPSVPTSVVYDVRAFGAVGDGRSLDTDAINQAIRAAAEAGGGTVWLSAGTYLSFSIRLRSRIVLHLDAGATLLAADPALHPGAYDLPEANEWDLYQDFGHSHWQNSLIWGIGLEDVAITGPGRIHGRGLTKRGPGPRRPEQPGDTPLTLGSEGAAVAALAAGDITAGRAGVEENMAGLGNKAIALKLCRRVTLRDFSILTGGHFAILPTGCDDLTIENLRIDTNRDGINLDGCRRVRVSHCVINAPNDDALVLKSSYALGHARPTEDVTITGCMVSGYDVGTMLDGTYGTTQQLAPDRDGVTGRIKFGTESNGAFRRIAIANCVFTRSRGLALETVDGAVIEDISVTNLVMRDVTTSPIFLRLGNRGRAPEGTPVGRLRRVKISHVVASDVDPRYATLLSGIPGHPIEDVELSDIRVVFRGGGTAADARREVPECEGAYPDPSMFGTIPAYGLFARHVRGLSVRDVHFSFEQSELRPAVILHDVRDADFDSVRAPVAPGVPAVVAHDVRGITLHRSFGAREMVIEAAGCETVFPE